MTRRSAALTRIREHIDNGGLGGEIEGTASVNGNPKPIKGHFEVFGAYKNGGGKIEVFARVTKLRFPEGLGDGVEDITEHMILDALEEKLPNLSRKKLDLNLSFNSGILTEDPVFDRKEFGGFMLDLCKANNMSPADTAVFLKELLDKVIFFIIKRHEREIEVLDSLFGQPCPDQGEEVYGYC